MKQRGPKNPQRNDGNATIHHLPQTDQYSASLPAMATSPKPTFPQFAEVMMVVWHAISFWSIWASCLSCDLPTSCLRPPHSQGKMWGGESLETTQALLSSSQNIAVPPAHHKQPHTGCYEGKYFHSSHTWYGILV